MTGFRDDDTDDDVEIEETLLVTSDDTESVLDRIWPMSGVISADDANLQLSAVEGSRILHVYGEAQEEGRRSRIKMRMKGGRIELRAQVKEIFGDGKRTSHDSGWLSGEGLRAQRIVAELGMIRAAFVKDRRALRYLCKGRPPLLIAVDRIRVIDGQSMTLVERPLWYVEIEGEEWLPPQTAAPVGTAFWAELMSVARPTLQGETKWELAEKLVPTPPRPLGRPNWLLSEACNALGQTQPSAVKLPTSDQIAQIVALLSL